MPSPLSYPYNPEANLPSNFIENEDHALVPPARIVDGSVIIAKAGPFFSTGPEAIKVYAGTINSKVLLTEGVDYKLVYKHIYLSDLLGRDLHGGIRFLNRTLNTTIFLEYNSIGGGFVVDDQNIFDAFSRAMYNVDYVNFEKFAGLPSGIAPTDHAVTGDSTTGYGALIDAVNLVTTAINEKNSNQSPSNNTALDAHIAANNAHTKEQVGLGNLNNWSFAVAGDYVVGTQNKYATPFGVKGYVQDVAVTPITALQSLVGDIGDQVDLNTTAITTLQNDLGDLEDAVSLIDEDVGDLINWRTSVNQDIQALQALTANLANDQGTNYSIATNAQTKANLSISLLTSLNTLTFLDSGVYSFYIAPTRKKTVVLVTSGGFGGESVADALDYLDLRKLRGSISLRRLSDKTTGVYLDKSVEILLAKSGVHGGYTFAPTRYGLGGVAGSVVLDNAEFDVAPTVTVGSAGVDGVTGQLTPNAGGIGFAIGGFDYGYGQDGEPEAGSGGSGVKVEFVISNTGTQYVHYQLVFENPIPLSEMANNQHPVLTMIDAAV